MRLRLAAAANSLVLGASRLHPCLLRPELARRVKQATLPLVRPNAGAHLYLLQGVRCKAASLVTPAGGDHTRNSASSRYLAGPSLIEHQLQVVLSPVM